MVALFCVSCSLLGISQLFARTEPGHACRSGSHAHFSRKSCLEERSPTICHGSICRSPCATAYLNNSMHAHPTEISDEFCLQFSRWLGAVESSNLRQICLRFFSGVNSMISSLTRKDLVGRPDHMRPKHACICTIIFNCARTMHIACAQNLHNGVRMALAVA